jgi:hypothetical protein
VVQESIGADIDDDHLAVPGDAQVMHCLIGDLA